MTLQRENFHTLDALRFFSFFLVFLYHIPYSILTFRVSGDIGVYFFFVLSGFLITYILLSEKKNSENFNFKKYMIRRVLRIWPLYFVILLFAFLTPVLLSLINLESSSVGYSPNWLLSCLFLENYMVIYHNCFSNVSPIPVIWSLCVEEHFYIVWGLILLLNKRKNIPYWIIGLIVLANVSRYIFNQNELMFKDILTNFDYFMYGAIPAYLYVYFKEKTIEKIENFSNLYKLILLISTLLYVLCSPNLDFNSKNLIEPTILGILFCTVLFIILPKKNNFKISSSNLFSKLGIYTYGLYMIHAIIINLMLRIYEKTNFLVSNPIKLLIIFSSSISITIIASICCYSLIEKPFLKLKTKF